MNEAENFVRLKWMDQGYEMIRSGWPDFLAVKGRDYVGVEVKSEHDKLSDSQERVRDILRELGVRYIVETPDPFSIAHRLSSDVGEDGHLEIGLFEPDAPDRIIAAARDDIDWGIAWCCLKLGMHPSNIIGLKMSNLAESGVLIWRRVKNDKPLRALLEADDIPRMRAFLKKMEKRPYTREGIWIRASKLTQRAGFRGGPRVLRKTFILNELRNNWTRPDILDLVAQKAGCTRKVLIQHYLDLEQWQKAYGKK